MITRSLRRPAAHVCPLRGRPRTSSLLTRRFLIAFCAAALVAIRRPSAASRSFCCCSSLSGFAAAP